ncbi:hypothetical protein Esti_003551 [Eimeria stiedai]
MQVSGGIDPTSSSGVLHQCDLRTPQLQAAAADLRPCSLPVDSVPQPPGQCAAPLPSQLLPTQATCLSPDVDTAATAAAAAASCCFQQPLGPPAKRQRSVSAARVAAGGTEAEAASSLGHTAAASNVHRNLPTSFSSEQQQQQQQQQQGVLQVAAGGEGAGGWGPGGGEESASSLTRLQSRGGSFSGVCTASQPAAAVQSAGHEGGLSLGVFFGQAGDDIDFDSVLLNQQQHSRPHADNSATRGDALEGSNCAPAAPAASAAGGPALEGELSAGAGLAFSAGEGVAGSFMGHASEGIAAPTAAAAAPAAAEVAAASRGSLGVDVESTTHREAPAAVDAHDCSSSSEGSSNSESSSSSSSRWSEDNRSSSSSGAHGVGSECVLAEADHGLAATVDDARGPTSSSSSNDSRSSSNSSSNDGSSGANDPEEESGEGVNEVIDLSSVEIVDLDEGGVEGAVPVVDVEETEALCVDEALPGGSDPRSQAAAAEPQQQAVVLDSDDDDVVELRFRQGPTFSVEQYSHYLTRHLMLYPQSAAAGFSSVPVSAHLRHRLLQQQIESTQDDEDDSNSNAALPRCPICLKKYRQQQQEEEALKLESKTEAADDASAAPSQQPAEPSQVESATAPPPVGAAGRQEQEGWGRGSPHPPLQPLLPAAPSTVEADRDHVVALKCGHVFCKGCIVAALRSRRQCPNTHSPVIEASTINGVAQYHRQPCAITADCLS